MFQHVTTEVSGTQKNRRYVKGTVSLPLDEAPFHTALAVGFFVGRRTANKTLSALATYAYNDLVARMLLAWDDKIPTEFRALVTPGLYKRLRPYMEAVIQREQTIRTDGPIKADAEGNI